MTGTEGGTTAVEADSSGETKPGKMVASNGTHESDELLKPPADLDPERAERLRIATIVVCVISVICTFLEGSGTLAIAIMESSAASFAFAFTALLDSLTSVVVIWRYCGARDDIFAIEKEKRALFCLGILFVISFFTTFGKSVYALVYAVLPRKDPLTWNIAIVNTAVSAALACSKFYLSAQLSSRSIFTDGINSGISTMLAAAIIASSVVYDAHPSVWFLDAVVGVICACFLLVWGIKLLYTGKDCLSRLLTSGSQKQHSEYVKMDDMQ